MRRLIRLAVLAGAAFSVACGSTDSNPTATPPPGSRASATTGAAPPIGSGTPGDVLTGRLLLTRSNALVVRDMATGDEQTIVEAGGENFIIDPAWSPDGSKVAYAVQITLDPGNADDYGSDIYVADADGGNATLVVKHEAPGDFHRAPDFAPDGKTLYFTRSVIDRATGSPQPIFDVATLDLASGQVAEAIPQAYGGEVSHDGRQFVYVDLSTGGQQLVVRDLASGKNTVLASPDDGLNFFGSPRFSPDDGTVVFAASGAAGSVPGIRRESGPFEWLVDLVIGSPAEADGPPWDLYLVGTNGKELRRLTEVYDDQPYPDWDRDGKNIVYIGITGLVYLSADKTHEPSKLSDGLLHAQLDWLP